jgi:hypothetical protein
MRINRIFEGSTEIMHLLIAREAVDQHLAVAGDILEPEVELKRKAQAAVEAGKFYSRWLPQLAVGEGNNPSSYSEFGKLAKHLRYVERAARKQARNTFYGMNRWQAKMEYKQAFLGRIVDIGAELFAISAAVVYANTQAQEHPERREELFELAELFCAQARLRSDRLFEELWTNNDDANNKFAKKVLEGRYTFLEQGIVDKAGDGPHMPKEVEGIAEQDGAAQSSSNEATAGESNGHASTLPVAVQ